MGVFGVRLGLFFVRIGGGFSGGRGVGVQKFAGVVLGVRRRVRRFLWLGLILGLVLVGLVRRVRILLFCEWRL